MQIRWTKGMECFDDAFSVRKAVFIDEQSIPEEIEIDEVDGYATHLVLFLKGKPVATGRLYGKDKRSYIGRICVLDTHRGTGVGRVLMDFLLQKAAEYGNNDIYLSSQMYARGFYQSFGFEEFGETFDDGGIEHVWMLKKR
ncbi:GNAT family N-acetyltransferase [Methanococcoides sp. AM1]|uniref:GNAT family N-acetyltransferase n=1 Tax=Methanococcoides sp. AM1 TaxID=1201011 RepID=UPI00108330F6|nr:GNAT family N-acetyltransferase [Methanococcoides sp. AM1]